MNDKKNINPSEFVELMDSLTESQIVFIKSVLDDAGIHYIVCGDSHAYIPHAVIPARVFVRKDDIEKARMLLKEFI